MSKYHSEHSSDTQPRTTIYPMQPCEIVTRDDLARLRAIEARSREVIAAFDTDGERSEMWAALSRLRAVL